jgi:hypothetical protein
MNTKKFDYIIIICPTFRFNKTYNRKFIVKDLDVIPLEINDKLNDVLLKIVEKFKDHDEQTLIIVDDCANLYDAKLKATALTKLAFHGRHINITTWLITQKYNAIVKDFRENIKMLVLFYDKDKDSRDAAFKENDIDINSEEKDDVIKILNGTKSSKLVMQLFHPLKWQMLT